MVAEDSKFLRLVYTFFLGILLAVFIGVGVNTFYPGPIIPEYPYETSVRYEKEPTDEQRALDLKHEQQMREYDKATQPYSRNVSIITLAFAVLLLVGSILFSRKIQFVADGVMLGGLFTLIYSLGRSIASQDSKYMFVAVTVALIIAIFLGYRRFIKPAQATTSRKKSR